MHIFTAIILTFYFIRAHGLTCYKCTWGTDTHRFLNAHDCQEPTVQGCRADASARIGEPRCYTMRTINMDTAKHSDEYNTTIKREYGCYNDLESKLDDADREQNWKIAVSPKPNTCFEQTIDHGGNTIHKYVICTCDDNYCNDSEGLGITETPVSVESLRYETKQEGNSESTASSDAGPASEHTPSAASTLHSVLASVLATVFMQL